MRIAEKLKTFPWHIAGICVFFITHGYSEYTWLVPVASLLLLLLALLAGSFLLFLLVRKTVLSSLKAGLFITWLLAFLLFYGAWQDFLQDIPSLYWLSRYRYLLPLCLLTGLVLFVWLKRSRKDFSRITLYLNTLFIVLVAVDGVVIVRNLLTTRVQAGTSRINIEEISKNTGLKKPDVYFIVMDEYSGSTALKQYFNYHNNGIEDSLRSRNFFVAASPKANYPVTLMSMASVFTMDTIYWLQGRTQTEAKDYSIAREIISNSEVPSLFRGLGYKFYNYSIFPIANEPQIMDVGFIPVKLDLIISKTFVNRIKRDFIWRKFISESGSTNVMTEHYRRIYEGELNKIFSLTLTAAEQKTAEPKFVYAHLLMPHPPFLYDSTGAETKGNFKGDGYTEQGYKDAYLQYLVYTNKVIWQLVKDIQDKTKGQAVILLASDHGFRRLPKHRESPVSWANNFLSAYIPGNNYHSFHDSMTNINLFPAVFNSIFNTKLSMLPDSCIFDVNTN